MSSNTSAGKTGNCDNDDDDVQEVNVSSLVYQEKFNCKLWLYYSCCPIGGFCPIFSVLQS